MKRTYNVQDSHVFDNNEIFEIEIEVNNKEVGPTTDFNSAKSILLSLKKVIKFILSGLQGTNFPISYF